MEETRDCLGSVVKVEEENKDHVQTQVERERLNVLYVRPCQYGGDAEASIQSPGAQSSYMVVNKTEERVSPKVEEEEQDINPMSTGDLKKEIKTEEEQETEREGLHVQYVRPSPYYRDAEAGIQSSYMVANKTEERVSPKVEEEQDINPISTGDLKIEIKMEEERETEREGLHVQYVQPCPYYRDAEAGIQSPRAQSSYMAVYKMKEKVVIKVVEKGQDINLMSTGDLKKEIKTEEERETERKGLHVQYVQPCPYYGDAEAGIQSPGAQSSYMVVNKTEERVSPKVEEKGQDINPMSTGDLKKDVKTEGKRQAPYVCYVRPCQYGGDTEAGIQSPGAKSSYMAVYKMKEKVIIKVVEKGQDINLKSTGDLKNDVRTWSSERHLISSSITQDTNKNASIQHMSALHSNDLSRDPTGYVRSSVSSHIYQCSECGKYFISKSHLVLHERVHTGERPYSCSECGKCYTAKSSLIKHQRNHTGERQFSCSECDKCFTSKSCLVSHQGIHTGPYSCSECGKSFPKKAKLDKHVRIHTGEKPFSCSECGKCFIDKSHLVLHVKTHTGEKPYSCSECGKSFRKRVHLLTHLRIHTGEKPFSCSECGKCFNEKSTLVIHFRTHTGEKPHSCSECGKRFNKKSDLGRHQKIHTL